LDFVTKDNYKNNLHHRHRPTTIQLVGWCGGSKSNCIVLIKFMDDVIMNSLSLSFLVYYFRPYNACMWMFIVYLFVEYRIFLPTLNSRSHWNLYKTMEHYYRMCHFELLSACIMLSTIEPIIRKKFMPQKSHKFCTRAMQLFIYLEWQCCHVISMSDCQFLKYFYLF